MRRPGRSRLGFVFDGVHTLASAVWLGDSWRWRRDRTRNLRRQAATAALAAVVVGSRAGAVYVAAIVVTGVYRALAELRRCRLTDTGYGVALLVKLAVFALMLVVAAYSQFVIHPRLERCPGAGGDDRGAGPPAAKRPVRCPGGRGLAVVAVLVATTPPL